MPVPRVWFFCAMQAMEASYNQLAQRYEGSSNVRIAKFQADVERDFASSQLGLKTFPTIVMLPKVKGGFVKYPSERRDVDSLDMWVKAMAGHEQ